MISDLDARKSKKKGVPTTRSPEQNHNYQAKVRSQFDRDRARLQ